MITVDLNNDLLLLSFKFYPPYVSRVKRLGALFDHTNKIWYMKKQDIELLCKEFEGELLFNFPEWKLRGHNPPDYSKFYTIENPIDIKKLEFKLKPFKYQEFGIKFLVDRISKYSMAFIADSMGLGKTAQAIGTIKYFTNENKVKNTVIVCKKSIKTQWKEEIEKFIDFNGDVYISSDLKAKRTKTYEEIKNNKRNTILIINYHLLQNDADVINKMIKPDYVLFDEVHCVKKYNGEHNKACRKISTKAKYTLFMTGTPIMSKADDIFGIISIKDKKYFGTLKEFKERYLVEYYNGSFNSLVGYKNLNELREKVQNLILRRTSDEVTIELPEIVEKVIYCSKDKLQKDSEKIADNMQNFIDEKIETAKTNIKNASSTNSKEEANASLIQAEGMSKGLIAVKQIIANTPSIIHMSKSKWINNEFKDIVPKSNYMSEKIKTLLELVEDIKEANQKVVIFTKYETMANYIKGIFDKKNISNVTYTGGLTGDTREDSIQSFKNDPSITAIIGTDALAEGVSLQIANHVIHVDLAFNEAINSQRSGRARRAGSKYSNVFVYYLLTEDSIDVNIYNKVMETKKTFDNFISVNKEQSKILKELSN